MLRLVFFLIFTVINIEIACTIPLGYIQNATYVSSGTTAVITYTNTCAECICSGFFSSVPSSYVGLNCYRNNKTCELFANHSTSSMIKINLDSTFIFIQQSSLQNSRTATTSSTSTTPSTSSSTSTNATTSVTSTTAFRSCSSLQWNQTGISVAGTGSETTNSNGFQKPSWLHVNANGTFYVCDQQNNRVQMWTNGAKNGTTVAGSSASVQGSTSNLLRQPLILTFDNNGFMYVNDQGNNRVQRYSPNSLNGTTVAGQAGGGSNALNGLHNPTGIDVDDNSNLYIADTGNNRLMLWTPNATNGSILISNNLMRNVYGLVLASGSSNKVYLSSQGQHSIYLWTFNASAPNVTLTQVDDNPNTLNNPSGIILDPYGNLYVADKENNRVVMYCVNSTVGITVVGGSGSTPTLDHPIAIGFDSNLNLYVGTDDGDNVVRYALL